jgi:transcriptional regulator with XRE-family HTH domain
VRKSTRIYKNDAANAGRRRYTISQNRTRIFSHSFEFNSGVPIGRQGFSALCLDQGCGKFPLKYSLDQIVQAAKALPINVFVGERLRARRKLLRLSQKALGDTLGLTYQQIQKFETGTSRIAVSHLVEMADALGVSADYFFQGAPVGRQRHFSREIANALLAAEALDSPHIRRLARALSKVKDEAQRENIAAAFELLIAVLAPEKPAVLR